jgi:catechol 2,3-dioxygenase-like lactoylglutathione lyase family enzyme
MARLSHMVLPVVDLQRSRDWYIEKLGFTVEREQENVVGIKDAAGLTIFLWGGSESLAGRKITLTIEVGDVESKFQELQKAGVAFVSPPKKQFWGYGAEVLDPDGYMNHLWDSVTMKKATEGKK